MSTAIRYSFIALLLFVPHTRAAEPVKDWAARLTSDTPSEYRVAQAYLAHAGADGLPELAKLAEGADDRLKLRLKETLHLMLRNAAGPEPIQKHPKLWALGEAELKKASAAYKILAGSKKYYRGEIGPLPEHEAMNDLHGLRGFAIPVALDLLKDKQPGSRMCGFDILQGQGAIGHYQAILPLLKDDRPIQVFHGDYTVRTTVALQTADALRTRPFASAPNTEHAVPLEAENYADWLDIFAGGEENRFVLIGRLRSEANAFEAKSWDDYWQRATPVLKNAWDPK